MWLTGVCLGQTEGPLAVAPGFIPTACTGFLGTYSLWMNTLISLEIVGMTFGLPQNNVPYPLRVLERDGVEESGGSGRRRGSGNLDWYF